MTDTKSARPLAAGEGTWALPLLTLAPAAAIRHFTGLSTPWLVAAWVFCALAAVLAAMGWATVFRHGMRATGAWVTCILVHVVLVVQIIWLIRH